MNLVKWCRQQVDIIQMKFYENACIYIDYQVKARNEQPPDSLEI